MSELTPGSWESCPRGELTRLSAALAFQRRLRFAAVAGLVLLAGGAATAGAGWLAHTAFWPAPADPVCTPCRTDPAPCDSQPASSAPGHK